MHDYGSAVVVSFCKLVRIMFFWIALYFADKIYQDLFVQNAMIGDKAPPDLRTLIAVVLAIDLFLNCIVLMALMVVKSMYKTDLNTFVIDNALLVTFVFDYLATTFTLLAIGVMLADAAQNEPVLRYSEMGPRGTRAFADLILPVGVAIIAIPFYRII